MRTLTEKLQLLKGDESKLVEYLVDRLLLGQHNYGAWLARYEDRNLPRETGAELIDAVAYLCMEAMRLTSVGCAVCADVKEGVVR